MNAEERSALLNDVSGGKWERFLWNAFVASLLLSIGRVVVGVALLWCRFRFRILFWVALGNVAPS